MTGRVDQVDDVAFPVEPHRLQLDRDTALTLEIHRIEVLRLHIAHLDSTGEFEHPVGKRRLAVIDVGNDRCVANERLIHG